MTFIAGCQYPGAAGTITGPDSICADATNVGYSVSSITNATTYNWTVPTGANIETGQGTQSITVNFGSASGDVTVAGGNNCGYGASSSLPVTINTLPTPTITGINSLCVNSGYYNYSTETGMTNYIWTVSSGGSINSGQGTSTIQVNWFEAGAQTISVNYTNSNSCQATIPTMFDVAVNDVPDPAGTITGPTDLCAGTIGAAYSVPSIPNAITYIWTVPLGATIASGSGTNSITVDFSVSATSGNVTVYGNDFCGDGNSSSLAVTVNPIPATPVVTDTGYIAYSSAPAGNQWYLNGNIIPGATNQTYDAAPTGTGYYWTVVNLNGCSSDSSNHVYIVVEGVDSHSSAAINVHPVPNNGQFNLSITGVSKENYSIKIYDNLGMIIYQESNMEVNGSLQKMIDLGDVPDGVYIMILDNSSQQFLKKIIINK
ncbi:MAG: T9SS type A sorting domain-containing protein [Bacteroidales bacterium]|jgi:hypothetical protein